MSLKRLRSPCVLCKGYSNDKYTYGEVFEHENWNVHHFCMLFTNNCEQNGADEEGIEGFLPKDIIKAVNKNKSILCSHCHKFGANIKCKSCRLNFHTGCALKVNANFQFHDDFPVYCPGHNPIKFEETKQLDPTCAICFSKLIKKRSILIPCCKNSWFHHKCLQKYAYTSGYYNFACPLCADKSVCLSKLPKMGIFLPLRDAQWELDGDFADMAVPPQLICEFCDSSENYEENYLWRMCNACGGHGVHYSCLEGIEREDFTCRNCSEILEQKANKKDIREDFRILSSDSDDNDDEEEIVKKRRQKPKVLTYSSDEENHSPRKRKVFSTIVESDSEDEIIKPLSTKRLNRIESDSSDDDDDHEDFLIPQRRKKMKVLSSPETTPKKSQFSCRL